LSILPNILLNNTQTNKTVARTIYENKDTVVLKEEYLDVYLTSKNKLISQNITNDLLKSRALEMPRTRGFSSVLFIDDYGDGTGIMNYFYMPKEYEGKEIHLEYMP